MVKPKLLILSHVLPFPGDSGQQKRVYYSLREARKIFETSFLTVAPHSQVDVIKKKLSLECDQAIVFDSRYEENFQKKIFYQLAGFLYQMNTGLKFSNYILSQVEFSLPRIMDFLNSNHFDCALFEYWHAWESIPIFHQKAIPCVLDMHDILWRAFSRETGNRSRIKKYKSREEESWKSFDAVVAINREEQQYVQTCLSEQRQVFYAPMGTDLAHWPYSWKPVSPMRIAYYGSLGGRQNQENAMSCVTSIMPAVWKNFPNTELWFVGSNPSAALRKLGSRNSRIKVTGFLENPQEVLSTMTAVICPWSGTYGFRSRIVEVMALGVPVVASNDAVYGMELTHEKGILLGGNYKALSDYLLQMIRIPEFLQQQSLLARQQVEQLFSLENSYGKLMQELKQWLEKRTKVFK